jgi:hypothetical protein
MERREVGLGVLAIFLGAAVITGVRTGWGWLRGPTAWLVGLSLSLTLITAWLLAGASARTPRRALWGTLTGIVGIGLLAWPTTGAGLLLGIRIGAGLTLLGLIPKAWGRRGGVGYGR